MRRVTAKIDDDAYKMLKSSKILYDYIMQGYPEDTEWNSYIGLLLWLGIEAIIKSVTPADNPLLQATMLDMYKRNPEFVADFIADTLKVGGKIEQQDTRQQILGFIKRQEDNG
ncbi:MAG: hypothetical protein HYY41_06755 [Chloroflexi bacterium]|nr:hypothetical protein [Chloroflexota bacterium]MBI2980501.1 hypothetical protein [Chloroflexota bacterium]